MSEKNAGMNSIIRNKNGMKRRSFFLFKISESVQLNS